MKVWEGLAKLDETELAIKATPATLELPEDLRLLAKCLGSLEAALRCQVHQTGGQT